jgi:hypothetical protein
VRVDKFSNAFCEEPILTRDEARIWSAVGPRRGSCLARPALQCGCPEVARAGIAHPTGQARSLGPSYRGHGALETALMTQIRHSAKSNSLSCTKYRHRKCERHAGPDLFDRMPARAQVAHGRVPESDVEGQIILYLPDRSDQTG